MTKTNQQKSCGAAAEPTETQFNNTDQIMNTKLADEEKQEKAITLKEASMKYDCAPSSLKSNIKNNSLPAEQENEKSAYMVRPSEVERFLRDRPGIKSKFHTKPEETPTETLLESEPKANDEGTIQDKTPARPTIDKDLVTPDPVVPVATPKQEHSQPSNASVSGVEEQQVENKGKRRRQRRRGKRDGDQRPEGTHTKPLILRALCGTTDKERLRITACLNELASIVASV